MNNKSKANKIFYFLIIVLFLVLLGMSFAYFRVVLKPGKDIKAETSMIRVSYIEPNYEVSSKQMNDELGKSQNNYYEFTIKSETDSDVMLNYYIFAEETDDSNINSKYIKVYLTDDKDNPIGRFKKENADLYFNSLNDNGENINNVIEKRCMSFNKIISDSCDNTKSNIREVTYRLRYWISDEFSAPPVVNSNNKTHTALTEKKIFKFKVNVLVKET